MNVRVYVYVYVLSLVLKLVLQTGMVHVIKREEKTTSTTIKKIKLVKDQK